MYSILTVRNDGGWRAERDNVQQETEGRAYESTWQYMRGTVQNKTDFVCAGHFNKHLVVMSSGSMVFESCTKPWLVYIAFIKQRIRMGVEGNCRDPPTIMDLHGGTENTAENVSNDIRSPHRYLDPGCLVYEGRSVSQGTATFRAGQRTGIRTHLCNTVPLTRVPGEVLV
jgi:hypothetical protein